MAQQHSPDADPNRYYVPASSKWPFLGSIALFIAMIGFGSMLDDFSFGKPMFIGGLILVASVLFFWFRDVIRESESGKYNKRVDVSFRLGMMWFIMSEVFFFAAFFAALFYTRQFALPWMGGEGAKGMTNEILWQGFSGGWPSSGPGDVGGQFTTIPAWGLPLLNTLILLTSGITITIAHHALRADNRKQLKIFLGLTVLLGCIFLFFQAEEYIPAYSELNLTLGSGIYGSTFFMLTGFHGLHVLLGTIMLFVIWCRVMKGHFTPKNHFGFEAVAWYWHFVDVVWLGLFLFVYVL